MSTAEPNRGERLRNKAIAAILVLGGWQIASLFFQTHVMPGLLEVLVAAQKAIVNPKIGNYFLHTFDTFRRLLIGFLISLSVGTFLGVQMGLRDSVESFLRSWVILGLSIPSLAVAFALILIFGISEIVPVLTIIVIGIPFVMLNMWEGAQDLDGDILEMAEFYNVDKYQKVRDVVFPQLLPYIFPSMYWGFVVSWKVLFIAEVFGAGSGIGFMVSYWFEQQRVDMLMGWVVFPIVIVILAQEGLRAFESWVMDWR